VTFLVLCSCILKSRSSCLYKCADEISDISDLNNGQNINYQHFIRFFRTGKYEDIKKFIFQLLVHFLFATCENCHLVLDRTEWQFGKTWKNVLVIGAVYHGCFIPLVWRDLDRRGNSLMQTRLELIDVFCDWWQTIRPLPVFYLSGDREFIGDYWLQQLAAKNITFVIRLRNNHKLKVILKGKVKERSVRLKAVHKYMIKKELSVVEIVIQDEYIVNFLTVQTTCPEEPTLYLLTNCDDIEQAKSLYKSRWTIECCFKHLKTNGFDLENQGFQYLHKIELLMSVVIFVYAIAVYKGIIQQQKQEKIAVKNYKVTQKDGTIVQKQYKAKSVFRIGLTQIKKTLTSFENWLFYIQNQIIRC
jgi:hypothetical protein